MELSTDVLDGLHVVGNSAFISDECIKEFMDRVINSVLVTSTYDPPTDILFSSLEKGALKQAQYGLTTLFLEAAKHDRDGSTFIHILEDCKFSQDRVQLVTDIYSKVKPQLRILLSSTGNNPPHIVDVDWRLDYHVKTTNMDNVQEPTYLLSLKTEECGASETSQVKFSCSQDQLQDMVGKLRDACKTLERAGQN